MCELICRISLPLLVVVDSSECKGDELIAVNCCGDVRGKNCRVAQETNPRSHSASNVANTVSNVLYAAAGISH